MNLRKFKNENTSKYLSIIFLYIFILLLASCFTLTGDDYFFIGKGLSSFDEIKAIEPANGRYIGNILEVLIVNCSINGLGIIKTLFMGTGIFLLILLLSKLTKLNINFTYIYIAFLVLSACDGVYQEVYSWTPGYINYLIPTIGLFLSLLIFKYIFKYKKDNFLTIISIIFIGFSMQLFVEHMTIYFVLLSIVIVAVYFIKYKKITWTGTAYFVSTLSGACMMFSSSGYRGVLSENDAYRSTGFTSSTNLIHKFITNLVEASRDLVIRNVVLTIFLSIILITLLLLYKNTINSIKLFIKRINILIGGSTIIYVLLYKLFISNTGNLANNKYIYVLNIIIAFAFLFMLVSTIIFFIDDNKNKYYLLFYIISIIIICGPLLFLSPIGIRCFFTSYTLLILISLDLFSYLIQKSNINIKKINIVTITLLFITCITLLHIYNANKNIYDYRETHIKCEMNNNSTEILIPKYPYPSYVHNDSSIFLGTYYYYNYRNDITFKFIDND